MIPQGAGERERNLAPAGQRSLDFVEAGGVFGADPADHEDPSAANGDPGAVEFVPLRAAPGAFVAAALFLGARVEPHEDGQDRRGEPLFEPDGRGLGRVRRRRFPLRGRGAVHFPGRELVRERDRHRFVVAVHQDGVGEAGGPRLAGGGVELHVGRRRLGNPCDEPSVFAGDVEIRRLFRLLAGRGEVDRLHAGHRFFGDEQERAARRRVGGFHPGRDRFAAEADFDPLHGLRPQHRVRAHELVGSHREGRNAIRRALRDV